MKEIFESFNEVGLCKLDVHKTCVQNWQPKQVKNGAKICSDAFILSYNDKYKICFVRNSKPIVKAQISRSDALDVINNLGLTARGVGTFNAYSYRLTWYAIDRASKMVNKNAR